jgi:predicted Fe-S protein YdhL (DUF1289 family)
MPIVTQIVCDGCQTVKKEANHWYMLTIDQQTAALSPLRTTSEGQHHHERGTHRQFFCGRFCAVEAITRWMDHLANPARKRADVVPLDLEDLLPSEEALTCKRGS